VKAEIITIGDEVLRGEIVDSNKATLAQRLLQLDIECHHQVSVRDDRDDMRDAFLRALGRSDVVLVSGGLGPTRDDITSEVMAETFGRNLFLHEDSLEQIRAFFARIGREMTDTNRKQALFPDAAEVLLNPIGTAPGFAVKEQGSVFYCMPGVPSELVQMMDEQVLPRLAEQLEAPGGMMKMKVKVRVRVRARILRTFGMGESTLESELVDIARDGDAQLAFRTTFPDNLLRVFARATSIAEADAKIERVAKAIRERLGDIIYGEDDEGLETIVGRLLVEQGRTLAVAESCTGGLIAERVTAVPGSSAYFLGGVVAYANSAKQTLLGVPEPLLAEHGAVSEPVARAMAEGVRERFGADFGVATTGISGPDGGTDEKPVGLVYVAIATASRTHADQFVFPLDRARHRMLTSQVGLDWVRRSLLGLELVGPSLLRRQAGGPPPTGTRS